MSADYVRLPAMFSAYPAIFLPVNVVGTYDLLLTGINCTHEHNVHARSRM